MSTLEHPAVAYTAAALRAAGLHASADGIRILDDNVRTAALAAEALGVAVGAIANSLVFAARHGADDHPLLALTSGAHRADTRRLAELVGADEVRRADPAFVRRHTGHAIGGVGPVGHPAPLRTLVDRHLRHYEVVWAAAGHPKSVFPTTYADLVTLTGGVAADVSGEEDDPSS
ncbi:YbaK/EbsC family protein [Actinokineospora iranica]|uniref:Cys-tRNA(Pro) deacylase, prolyl-tRNA editing enzyme YbaK/EbsC n=1 Tax=Actinokineospora iranica TaxID=1271860 RepID=A0A1G6LXB4_9PSEU|nr:YbaK/EbsC family protein [Actinokineospora iranica]SDC47839.1 Cys-tRNA(Pro) deacylase, prolyl-tRNA editing enzyme YbaK/EbsC [Actinokineospora iranica]